MAEPPASGCAIRGAGFAGTSFESLSEQFELLVAGLQNQKASAEERTAILRRMRALIDAADQLVLNDELRPEVGAKPRLKYRKTRIPRALG